MATDNHLILCASVRDGKVRDIDFTKFDFVAKDFCKEHEKKGEEAFLRDFIVSDIDNNVESPYYDKPSNLGRKPLPIRCIETGQTFACISDLLKTLSGITRFMLDKKIRLGYGVFGNHYEYIKTKK